MKKFISKEKMSKKARKELNVKNRATWGNLNPTTKRIENKKAYNRKRAQKGFDCLLDGSFYLHIAG